MPRGRSPQKIRLESWYLKRVPFPAIPFADPFNIDPLQNGSIFDANLRLIEIEQIRNDVLQRGFPSVVKPWNWLWARKNMGRNFGMGKTALFTHVVNQINQDFGDSFLRHGANWLAIYARVQKNTNSVAKVAALVLAGICNDAQGVSVDRLILAKLRHAVIMLRRLGFYTQALERAAARQFLNEQWLENNGVNLQELATEVEKFLIEHLVSPETAKAIAYGLLPQHLAQINGSPNLRVPSNHLASQALAILLNDLARAAEAAAFQRVSIFLDDAYFLVLNTSATKRPDLAAEIRGLAVDGQYYAPSHNLFNWVAVMHTQTASKFSKAWEDSNMHYIAPIQFNLASSLVLRAIPYDQGRILLEAYLDYKRPKGIPDKSYPFTVEALETIARIAGEKTHAEIGKCDPRSLLDIAHRVFLDALSRETLPERIDVSFVEHVLNGKPLPAELDDKDDDENTVAPSEEQMPLGRPCPCTCHEGVEAHDTVVRLAGGTTQQDTRKILGYRCIACNLPVSLRVDSAPLNANNP